MMYLIEKDGERECVSDLAAYEDWEVLVEGDGAVKFDDEAVFEDGAWRVPLTVLQVRKWNEIKAIRDAIRYGGCMTAKGQIDSDPESQRKIGGAVSMAMMLGEVFLIEWTMADNTSASFNAAEMQAAGIALGMFESECHTIGRVLRDAIEAATTPEEVEAVAWPS